MKASNTTPPPEQETSRPPSVARSLHSAHGDDEDNNWQSRSENVIYDYQYLTQVDVYRRLLKMRLGTTVHHSNPRSRTLVGWKNSMPIEQYRYVRDHKRNQKNIPTSSSDYKEQHLIIAHRLAELEKRRVGTRYLPKGQKVEDKKGNGDDKCIIS